MSEPTQRDLDTAHKLQRQANPIGIAHALADARAEGSTPAATGNAALREAIIAWLLTFTGRDDQPTDADVRWLSNEADALLSGPLATLTAERDDLARKVERLREQRNTAVKALADEYARALGDQP